MLRNTCCATIGAVCIACSGLPAETTLFFDSSQSATVAASGVTSETISSHGYLFACTRDKLFTGGTGQVIGRQLRVPWPQGVEAQAVTTPPPGVTDHKARMVLRRVDGKPFDLIAFSVKLLANTGGAGASLEIMPLVNGEDAFNDPVYFNVTGYYGQTFSFNESPNYWGSTASLKGFDTYKIALYVDFAFVGLSLRSDAVPGDFDGDADVDPSDLDAFMGCASGPAAPIASGCETKDLDFDNDVDQADFGVLQRCFSGENTPGDPACGD